MSSNEILVLVFCQLIALCHGSSIAQLENRYDLTKHVHGKQLLSSAITDTVKSRSFLHCCALCLASEGCRGVAYEDKDCWFIDVTKTTCEIFNGQCNTCNYKVMMQTFSRDPSDCKSLLQRGHTDDGVYTINPTGIEPFQAFCEMTNGGWTVIQRRVDDSVDFYRGWTDYVCGFGNLSGNFWAGLDNIHALTIFDNTELLVTMDTFEDESAEAYYDSFYVDDAASGYTMSNSGYTGTTGNSMAYHSGRQFSTYDNDFDASTSSCAQMFRGAWWYGSCHSSNPNGLYLNGSNDQYATGVTWSAFKGQYYSLKTIEFKVRRIV